MLRKNRSIILRLWSPYGVSVNMLNKGKTLKTVIDIKIRLKEITGILKKHIHVMFFQYYIILFI